MSRYTSTPLAIIAHLSCCPASARSMQHSFDRSEIAGAEQVSLRSANCVPEPTDEYVDRLSPLAQRIEGAGLNGSYEILRIRHLFEDRPRKILRLDQLSRPAAGSSAMILQ